MLPIRISGQHVPARVTSISNGVLLTRKPRVADSRSCSRLKDSLSRSEGLNVESAAALSAKSTSIMSKCRVLCGNILQLQNVECSTALYEKALCAEMALLLLRALVSFQQCSIITAMEKSFRKT